MIISCPRCGRKLTVEPRLRGHLLGCPYCQARFAAPDPVRKAESSGWHGVLSGFLVSLSAMAKFVKRCWIDLTPATKGGTPSPHLHHSSYGNERTSGELHSEYDEESSHYYDLDEDDSDNDALDDNDSDEGFSGEHRYYDSHGMYVGYRDEEGWFHGEGGRNYAGYMEDDGSFYDGSGAYRGQIEDGGLLWEEGEGYTGFHEDGHFSEEGHYGVPDIYEEGGEGTGGVFDSLMDDDDED